MLTNNLHTFVLFAYSDRALFDGDSPSSFSSCIASENKKDLSQYFIIAKLYSYSYFLISNFFLYIKIIFSKHENYVYKVTKDIR